MTLRTFLLSALGQRGGRALGAEGSAGAERGALGFAARGILAGTAGAPASSAGQEGGTEEEPSAQLVAESEVPWGSAGLALRYREVRVGRVEERAALCSLIYCF